MATAYGPDTRDHQRDGSGAGDRPPVKHVLPAALRAPFEGRTWREFVYLMLSLPISVVLFSFAITMTSLGIGMLITFLGIPVLAAGLAMCRGFGALERTRARALLKLDVADPAPVRGRTGGLMSWVGAVLKSGVSWRHLLYAVLHFPWAVFAFCVSLTFWAYGWGALTYPLWRWVFPVYAGVDGIQLYGDRGHRVYLDSPFELAVTGAVGLLLVLVTPWIVRGLVCVDRVMVIGLLGPSRLATRVTELESDRGVVVDTAAADLRR
ncbi:sensor domain-containing protein, partial [Streptomyces fulvorobeus]